MAIIYLNDARIDTLAPTDEIVNNLMSSGWIVKSKTKDILRDGDVIANIEQGHIKFDMSSVVRQHDDSYVVTLNGINVFDNTQYPKDRYTAKVANTYYESWDTQIGLCTVIYEPESLFILETFVEYLIPKLLPGLQFREKELQLHNLIPAGFGTTNHMHIVSEEGIGVATDSNNYITVICCKVTDDMQMSCINNGEVQIRKLITQYKRVTLHEKALTIETTNDDTITLYLNGNKVTDVDICAGEVL